MQASRLIHKIIFFIIIILLAACINPIQEADEDSIFHWDNATIYFVYIDRFYNGNTKNDVNYNRKTDYGSSLKNVATFHGGDIVGLTEKLQANYFKNLGVTVIWITGIYEQIHGWVGGGDANDFPHYGYHGYYPMDFTAIDRNFGTIEEFRKFIDLAHEQGIRIIMDAGLNHPGYPTLLDAVQYRFGGVTLSEQQASEHIEGLSVGIDSNDEHFNIYSYLKYFDTAGSNSWDSWWGYDWIRTPEETNKDILTESIFGLPDFKTESKKPVGLPPLMINKWQMENEAYDAWINPSAIKYRKDLKLSQSDYVINWLAAWVEEFGIDGFRCDVLENVDTFRWAQLKKECNRALNKWRETNRTKSASNWQDDFWMTGDIWGAGIEYYPEYASSGFNSIVNFDFPKDGNLDAIGDIWQNYANDLNTNPNWTTVSFLNNTYKRDTDFSNIVNCGTSLLLSPGAIQIFYGDEVARPEKKTEATDQTHGYRSDFIWGENLDILEHWQKLGQFRKSHLSVGMGDQTEIAHNTFLRKYVGEKISDKVIIKLSEKEIEFIDVSNIFEEGLKLRDAYSGQTAVVINNTVQFHPQNNILLIEIVH